jgi:hypothetical protein
VKMKVAVLLLVVALAASANAGLFDGFLSVTFANSNLKALVDGFNSDISSVVTVIVTSITVVVNILISVGTNTIVMVSDFGLAAAGTVVIVTADAAEFSAYIAINFIATTVSNTIVGPYNTLIATINAQVAADIAGLNLLVLTGKVKYTCLQQVQVFITGNITEFRAEVRNATNQHNQKIKNQTDALNQRINDDFAALRKNISDTCTPKKSKEVQCDIDTYMALRPQIKQKGRDYVQQAKNDADANRQDAVTNAQALQADFNVRYQKITADIVKCSSS